MPASNFKPRPYDGATAHGDYYWDQNTTTLTVKITGGRTLEVRGENAVVVGWGLALSINQFYDTQELFLTNLANFLGIPRSRIYVAKIVPGSSRRRAALEGGSGGSSGSQVDIMIYDDPATSNNDVSSGFLPLQCMVAGRHAYVVMHRGLAAWRADVELLCLCPPSAATAGASN